MGLGVYRNNLKTFGTTVYGLTHPFFGNRWVTDPSPRTYLVKYKILKHPSKWAAVGQK